MSEKPATLTRATLSRETPSRETPCRAVPTLNLRTVLTLVCALLLVASPASVRAQGGSAAPLGGDSPQDVFDKAMAAGEDEDLGTMVGLIAPEDRAMLSMTMIMMMGMVMAFSQMGAGMAEGMAEGMGGEMSEEEQAAMEAEREEAMAQVKQFEADFEETLKRYGVEEVMESESDDPVELMADVDQVGLIRDLMKLMDDLPGEEGPEDGESPVDLPEGDLTDLEIQGDTATGIIGGEPVEFVRIDGRWYLSLGLKEQMQQQMGGAMEGMEP